MSNKQVVLWVFILGLGLAWGIVEMVSKKPFDAMVTCSLVLIAQTFLFRLNDK